MIQIRKPDWFKDVEIPLEECTVHECSDMEGGYCVICHSWHTAVAFGTLEECKGFIGEHECILRTDLDGYCMVCLKEVGPSLDDDLDMFERSDAQMGIYHN